MLSIPMESNFYLQIKKRLVEKVNFQTVEKPLYGIRIDTRKPHRG